MFRIYTIINSFIAWLYERRQKTLHIQKPYFTDHHKQGEEKPTPLKPAAPLLPHQKHTAVMPRTISPPVKTLVIGLGGLGGHAVTYLRHHSEYKLDTCAADTNAKDLKYTAALFRILLGKNELHGLGTGIEPEISADLMRKNLPELEGFIKLHGYQMIVAIAGAGGGTGSGALPVIAEFAREKALDFLPIITMPFDFEGRKKLAIAESVQTILQASYPDVFIVHQQQLLKEYPNVSFKDALDQSLFAIMQGVEKCTAELNFTKAGFHEKIA